jgi:hypothetical protein
LDHITPYDHAHPDRRDSEGRAQTNAHNLHPLCKAHHQAKTAGIITPLPDRTQGTSGRTTWVLHTGHVAWNDTEPLHPATYARDIGIGLGIRTSTGAPLTVKDPPHHPNNPDNPDDDDPPPF